MRHGLALDRNFRLSLRLTQPNTLRIEVTHNLLKAGPHPTEPTTPLTESGRGLLLVEALSDTWGTELGPIPKKTLWADITPS